MSKNNGSPTMGSTRMANSQAVELEGRRPSGTTPMAMILMP